MELRQSPNYAGYMSRTGWEVLKLKNGVSVYKRQLWKLGCVMKIQRFEWPIDLKEVDELAKEHGSLFVKLEPDIQIKNQKSKIKNIIKGLRMRGFRPDNWPLAPPTTRVLDLSLSEEQLLNQFSVNCRRNIKKAASNKLEVISNKNHLFYKHWQRTARKRNLAIPSWHNLQEMKKSFGEDMKVLSVLKNDVWLGGVVLLKVKKRMYYFFATVNEQGKTLRASYLAVWEGVKLSKRLGCKVWDWEGVADARYKATNDAAWRGFGEFKSKFGGEEVQYAGSFVKYYGWGKMLEIFDRII